MTSRVATIKCDEYSDTAVYTAVKNAVSLLGGIESFVKKRERILIKPNLLSGKPAEKAVTTHPTIVRAVIKLVKEAGGIPIVGDSPGIGSASKVANICGIMEAVIAENAGFVDLNTPCEVENTNGHTFKRLEIAKEALDVDGIINVPKLKTHAQMFMTAGVKNMFGCVPGKKKAQWHLTAGVDTQAFAGMLLDLYLYLKPRLTIADAIVSMEGNGPGSGDPKKTGFIAASSDAIALDTALIELLGKKAEDVPTLKKAKQLGIERKPEIIGDKIKIDGFSFPPLISVNFTSGLPYFLDKYLRKTLSARPYINSKDCTLCNSCVSICPPKIMAKIMDKKNRIVIAYDGCIRCYCCQEICPEGAISIKEGLLKKIIPGL